MKSSKTMTLFIIVFVISASALALSIFSHIKADAPFTIAITKSHAKLFENYQALTSKLNVEVVLEIYENEADLMKAVNGGFVDAYSINVFAYIEHFADLPKGQAILGLPSDYYLIAKQERTIDRPKIGLFDETLTNYMLSGVKYASISYSNTHDRLNALRDGLIDYAVIPSTDYDPSQGIITKKMSALGYKEDLFILTRPWIESDIEVELDIVQQFSATLTQETKAPDEAMLMKVMSELFMDERIPTRYYYKDLVYNTTP